MTSYPMLRDTQIKDIYAIAPANALMWLLELGVGFRLDSTPHRCRKMTTELYYHQKTWFYYRVDSVRRVLDTSKLTTVGEVWLLYLACKQDDELNLITMYEGGRCEYATLWERFNDARYWRITEPKHSPGGVWVFEKVPLPPSNYALPLGLYLDAIRRTVVGAHPDGISESRYNDLDTAGTFGNWITNQQRVIGVTNKVEIETKREQEIPPTNSVLTVQPEGELTEVLFHNTHSFEYALMWGFIKPNQTWHIQPYYNGTLDVKCTLTKCVADWVKTGFFIYKSGVKDQFGVHPLRITKAEPNTVSVYEHNGQASFGTAEQWVNGLVPTGEVEHLSGVLSEDTAFDVIETDQPWYLTALDVTVPSLFAVSGQLTLEVKPSSQDASLMDFVLARSGNILTVNRLTLEQLDGFDIRFNHLVLRIGRIAVDVSGDYPTLTFI